MEYDYIEWRCCLSMLCFWGPGCAVIGHGRWALGSTTAKHFRNQNPIRGGVTVHLSISKSILTLPFLKAAVHVW